MKNTGTIIHKGVIGTIYEIRGMKVMLDSDLARLYGVETRVLNQAVSRNKDRFPPDFAFTISRKEFRDLKSQFVISSWGGTRKMPTAFSEYGVLMLSSVLKSERAINVNIQIMRTFVALREALATTADLRKKIEDMEQKYDQQFQVVFSAIKQMLAYDEAVSTRKLGFDTSVD